MSKYKPIDDRIVDAALLAAAYFWAKETDLDLITRGEGRLIAEGQNKLVQSPEGGVVSEIYVDEGDVVEKDQLIALINSTAAEGSLEEVLAKRNSLAAKLVRLDAELQDSTKDLNRSLDEYSDGVKESQIALFLANRSNLGSRLFIR